MRKLNPDAPSFFPSSKPNLKISTEPNQIPQVTPQSPPPPPSCYQQPYSHNNVSDHTTSDDHQRLPPTSKGNGRRKGTRRWQPSLPPRLAGRQNGAAGYGGRVQPPADDKTSKAFRRFNKPKQPVVVPVEHDGNTTIMIRNIPNRYTRGMLIDFLEKHCFSENQKLADKREGHTESAFDLVYLPIDFATHMNKGYGFVNFTNPDGAWRFHVGTNGQKWEFFQSNKVRDNVVARHQGKEKLMTHLSSMRLPSEREEVLPLCFSPPRDGTIRGSQRTLGKHNDVNGRSSRPNRSQWIVKEEKKKTPSPAAVHNVSSDEADES